MRNNLSYFAIAFFLEENPREHLQKLIQFITESLYKKYGLDCQYIELVHTNLIKSLCEEADLEYEYRKLGVACFISSGDFERADLYYDRFIEPNLSNYNSSEFVILLDGCNKNNQVYWRNRGNEDCLKILRCAREKLPDDHDFSNYTNLPIENMGEEVA